MKLLKYSLCSLICFNELLAAESICPPGETKIRSFYVSSYKRTDGTPVNGYFKNQHCRKSNYTGGDLQFSDIRPNGWANNEKFKSWNKIEMETVLKVLDNLPPYIRTRSIHSFHRGIKSIFRNNPAATLPSTREIVLYAPFFLRSDKERILTHEIAHLIYTELTSRQKVEFAEILGWNLSAYPPSPPKKGLYSDSIDSPSEDIANHLEAYFFDSKKQFKFNKKIPEFIHLTIGQMK